MKTRFMLAFLVVCTTAALFTFAGVGLADPPDMLFDPVRSIGTSC